MLNALLVTWPYRLIGQVRVCNGVLSNFNFPTCDAMDKFADMGPFRYARDLLFFSRPHPWKFTMNDLRRGCAKRSISNP